jgi:hypothetical protein
VTSQGMITGGAATVQLVQSTSGTGTITPSSITGSSSTTQGIQSTQGQGLVTPQSGITGTAATIQPVQATRGQGQIIPPAIIGQAATTQGGQHTQGQGSIYSGEYDGEVFIATVQITLNKIATVALCRGIAKAVTLTPVQAEIVTMTRGLKRTVQV